MLSIIGTRGVPAAHGGFETFAERLALYLVAQGWQVSVYCQQAGHGPVTEDTWQGIRRVHIRAGNDTPAATVVFDWKAIAHAASHGGLCLTLGYNTAVFCARLRFAGVPNVINMDGIEWRRAKWGPMAKAWFWLNEFAGSWLGDALVADHPEIARHLARAVRAEKIAVIPYGGDRIASAQVSIVQGLGLEPGTYLTLVARPEPENSVLEVVRGFSQRPRAQTLVVLGNYLDTHPYHRSVKAAASREVRFLGAIYDKAVLQALRQHCSAYVHGHQVGGTNPSLVEALGAGNAVIAHDNRFNRWVAANAACYFHDAQTLESAFDLVLGGGEPLQRLQVAAVRRHAAAFTWDRVLADYDVLLTSHLPRILRVGTI